jgi:transposase
MLSLPSSVRIFLCGAPADMRRSFDGLARMVEEFVGGDPLSGHWFVFRNRRGDRLKILCWERHGYIIWYKRLEEGTFRFPDEPGPDVRLSSVEASVCVSTAELAMILEGVEWEGVRKRRRYERHIA